MSRRDALHEDALKALIEAGSVREFVVQRGPGGEGWTLWARLGSRLWALRSRREALRVFASLTALGRFAEGLGVRAFTVEL